VDTAEGPEERIGQISELLRMVSAGGGLEVGVFNIQGLFPASMSVLEIKYQRVRRE
jgi:hypothetical protein